MDISYLGSKPSVPGPTDGFTGSVRIDPLFDATEFARASGGSVTFEPGARTAWHTHPRGQILIVTSGLGLVQREGKPVETIRPGDVVRIAPDERHWHGAGPQTAMTHILIVLASFFAVFFCLQATANAFDDQGETARHMTIRSQEHAVVYALNDSSAAKALYAQLPMTIEVEKYGGNEIIFYPPKRLDSANTPLVKRAVRGTLAYYAPWGDVVMFYEPFGSAEGLYELGHARSGADFIETLSGTVRIDKGRE